MKEVYREVGASAMSPHSPVLSCTPPSSRTLGRIGAVSGPYRGRIRAVSGRIGAVSGPYRGRIGAVSGPYRGCIGAVSGPYRGRIGAVSGPYRGRIGACRIATLRVGSGRKSTGDQFSYTVKLKLIT